MIRPWRADDPAPPPTGEGGDDPGHVRQPLTARQRRVYDFVANALRRRGTAPDYAQIAEHLGVRSTATVHQHVQALVDKGWLIKEHGRARSLRVLEEGDVAHPGPENGYTIPPRARYVPVSALPGLFREWLRKRQAS